MGNPSLSIVLQKFLALSLTLRVDPLILPLLYVYLVEKTPEQGQCSLLDMIIFDT